MRRVTAPVLGILLALAATAALGALSQAPYARTASPAPLLRLAWRVRGTPVHQCRRLTAEELARLPPHMRRTEECERRILPYRLHVLVDGRTVIDHLVEAAGARSDRPLYVLDEVTLPPGEHLVEIAFTREPQAEEAPEHEQAETPEEEAREHAGDTAASPARLTFSGRLALGAGEIALVTYDPDRQALVLRGAARPG